MRSLTLDKWEPTLLHFLTTVGNEKANSLVWAAAVPAEQHRPPETTDWLGREAWILAKYRDKKFVPPLPFGQTKQSLVPFLHKAVLNCELDRTRLILTDKHLLILSFLYCHSMPARRDAPRDCARR